MSQDDLAGDGVSKVSAAVIEVRKGERGRGRAGLVLLTFFVNQV